MHTHHHQTTPRYHELNIKGKRNICVLDFCTRGPSHFANSAILTDIINEISFAKCTGYSRGGLSRDLQYVVVRIQIPAYSCMPRSDSLLRGRAPVWRKHIPKL